MSIWVMIAVFVISAAAGYKLISDVPSLLHTPLMSGMNALSGVTVLGALTAAAFSVAAGSTLMGFIAVVAGSINVTAGFLVTDRMLRMFKSDR